MKRQLALCALLLWAGGVQAFSIHDVDVFDRPVAPLLSRGRPTLVLYANRTTQNAVHEPATQLAVRLRDVPFVTLVRVDLRGVPSLFRGWARRTIRNRHHDGVEEYQRAFRAVGAAAPTDAADRLVLMVDPDGSAEQEVGLPAGFSEALALVLDCRGNELARGMFPREAERIEHAIRSGQCLSP
jgi:hypothetical protein